MLFNTRVLVCGVCLMALASQSILPAWAATQEPSTLGKLTQIPKDLKDHVVFGQKMKAYVKEKGLTWRTLSPRTVCRDASFNAIPNCVQLAAQKWLDLYVEDKDNSRFFVNLEAVQDEQDLIAILKQVGKMNIPLTHIRDFMQRLEKIGGEMLSALDKETRQKLKKEIVLRGIRGAQVGVILGGIVGFGSLILGIILASETGGVSVLIGLGTGVGTTLLGASAGFVVAGSSIPSIITLAAILNDFKENPNPKVPIVQVPLLTDGIATTLRQDLPQLKLLRLDPQTVQVNLKTDADLGRLTLALTKSPDQLDLKDLLNKTNIRRLDLVNIAFTTDGLRKVGEGFAQRSFEHVDMMGSKINANGLGAFVKAMGKGGIENLQLMGALAQGGGAMGQALGDLLLQSDIKLLNLSRNPLAADGVEALANTLDRKISIPEVVLMNAFETPGYETGKALGALLTKFNSKIFDLSFNAFTSETIRGLKEGLGEQKLAISQLKLAHALQPDGYGEMVDALIKLLPKLKSLETFDLRHNSFDSKEKKTIKDAIKAEGMQGKVKL